ncbi:MAG TPA: ATP-binding protein [Actinomycetota bacterium]|nr:ATP-binding protein [Actinomycetota bacterium]
MRSWGLASIADNAILMISELVTNAILHGGHGALLSLSVSPSKLRAEVRDASRAQPVVRSYSETATTGRGMVIVDALAGAWGSFPVDGGKVVWFELDTGDRRKQTARRKARKPADPPRQASDLRQPFVGSSDAGSDERPSARVRLTVGRRPTR